MKALFVGIVSALIAAFALSNTAGATFIGSNGYIGVNGASSTGSWSHVGFKDGKLIIEGESYICTQGNFILGGVYASNTQVQQPKPVLPAADVSGCNANQVINDPPANSTVTISGICDADAAKLKTGITGDNVTVIVNSTGPCKEDKPTVIDVNVNHDIPQTTDKVVTASVTKTDDGVTNPKGGGAVSELPQTGISPMVPVVAAGLAALTYAGGMAIRAFRARA